LTNYRSANTAILIGCFTPKNYNSHSYNSQNENLILSNDEIFSHRLPVLFHTQDWNLLISLLALILQRATSGQVLSLIHVLMLGFLASCGTKLA